MIQILTINGRAGENAVVSAAKGGRINRDKAGSAAAKYRREVLWVRQGPETGPFWLYGAVTLSAMRPENPGNALGGVDLTFATRAAGNA